MPSDEEILIERMREWNDDWGGPAPLCKPPEKHAVLPTIWKVEGSECSGKADKETWRDRAIKDPML